MRLEGVEVVTVRLSLREPIQSAGLVQRDKTTLFVRVVADEGSGWGECASYPAARAPDVPVDQMATELEQAVRRLFAAATADRLPDVDTVSGVCAHAGSVAEQSAAAAIEMAVLDLVLSAEARPLAEALGAARPRVEYGALVGIPSDRDVGRLIEGIAVALAAGARRVRVKIEPGWERIPLHAARDRFPDAVLYADANGSFRPDDVPVLLSLDRLGLRCLEQPFQPGQWAAHQRLGAAMTTPIGLDESLWSVEQVRRALALGACRVACLKPGRLGGLFPAIEAASACTAAGVECFVGGFFESGLGRAANAALAGRSDFGLPGDLSSPAGYLDAQPFTSLRAAEGTVELSHGPGIGVAPRAAVLAERTVVRRWFAYSRAR